MENEQWRVAEHVGGVYADKRATAYISVAAVASDTARREPCRMRTMREELQRTGNLQPFWVKRMSVLT